MDLPHGLSAHSTFNVKSVIEKLGTHRNAQGLLSTEFVLVVIESQVHTRRNLGDPMTKLIRKELGALSGIEKTSNGSLGQVGAKELIHYQQAQSLPLQLFLVYQGVFHQRLNARVGIRGLDIKTQGWPH